MQIYVSGSLAFDRIMDFPGKFADHILPDKIHILNVCFTVNGLQEKFGGTAGNIAYSLALLGEKPLILATLGRDADRYLQHLMELDLPLDGIRRVEDEFTAGAYITTDQTDNQITGFNPGAMKHQCGFEFNGADPADSLAVIAPGNPDDMLEFSRQYKKMGLPYIFDPGQQIPITPAERMREMIDGAFMLISNDYELEMIEKATGWSKADLQEKTSVILTTLAEKGSLIRRGGEQTMIGAAKVEAVKDPTGAGDSFRSGLLKGLAEKRDLTTAARMGAVSAAYAVEQYGTQEHYFTPEDFWARYRANFGEPA